MFNYHVNNNLCVSVPNKHKKYSISQVPIKIKIVHTVLEFCHKHDGLYSFF